MDKIDRKILYELDKNSQESFSKIGNLTKISKETIRYRFEKLVKEGIIKKTISIINVSIIGYSYYQIFIKLQNINKEKKETMLNFLEKNQKVSWVGRLEGKYDLGIILIIKNQYEINQFLEEFNNKFNSIIMKKSIIINLEGGFLERGYLIDKKRTLSVKKDYLQKNDTEIIDKKDEIICKELAKNSRISYIELSKKVNLSADAVLIRIKKLRKRNILNNSLLIIDNNSINQQHYKILFYLTKTEKEKILKLISEIKANNRVISFVKTLAEWDYEVDIEVENINQLRDFTMNLTDSFSDLIRDYEVIQVVDMPKYNFFP